ncbi:MAG: magnesium transporter [Planctomycetota bacterium]
MYENPPHSYKMPPEDLYRIISENLEKDQFKKVQKILTAMHPAEIATLITGLGGLERNLVFDLSPAELQHEILVELEEVDQEHQLKRLSDDRIAEILILLDSDDATDIAALLDEPTREQVLDATPHEDRKEVEQLLGYDEETAGGLMALEFVTVLSNKKVQDAVEAIRTARKNGIDDVHYVYVVDPDKTLRGRIALVDLITANRDAALPEIMEESLVVVTEDMDQEAVAQIFERYDLISAPVVNAQHKLVGRITIDDVVDVIREEADEDLGFLAGTGEEEVTERSLFASVKSRFPWLFIALMGELVGAVVIFHFKQSIEERAIIAIFIPAMIAMAGNVGIQSSTLVVRGLATGEIMANKIFTRVIREILVATMNGVLLAAILILSVCFWSEGGMRLGMALGISMITVIILAALVGSIIPFVLKKLKQDPALASGPFITMTNDVLGLVLYLLITRAFLG